MSFTLVTGREGRLSAQDYPEVAESPRFTCSLGGAYGATLAVLGAVPILHSGSGCGMANAHGMTYASGLNSGGPAGTTVTPCSGLIEEHVVFGGEDKLRRLIDSCIKLMKGDLFVVISGCVPALIGDDVDSVVAEFTDRAKVIHVKTSGFVGNAYTGYNLFLDAVIDGVLKPRPVTKKLVNLFGIVPNQNIFWKGELRTMKLLLEGIGAKVNTIFSDFGSLGTLEKIPEAELNILFHPWAGTEAVKKLEERFGTPWLKQDFVPVGPKDTSDFLRRTAQKLKIGSRKVEAFIKNEEKYVYRFMEYLTELFMIAMPHSFVAVAADSRTAISFVRYGANELGWNPELAIVTDDPPEWSRENITAKLTEGLEGPTVPRVVYEIDSHRIRQEFKRQPLQVILASSLEKYISKTENEAHHLSISYPTYDRLIVDRNYAGYRGGIAMLEDMSHAFAGPS
jgi:nitrogenase molybdenum-iron protein beta chain